MHIVSYKAIRLFSQKHVNAQAALDRWFKIARKATWANFADVRTCFNTADFVSPYVVFDTGGNKYRLIAKINYRARVLFIHAVMSHKEYEKGAWTS
jgi:mRNA interferase HigB